MKFKLYFLFVLFVCLSCQSNKNTPNFIYGTQGRYYFNADETIEVYFIDNVLFMKWRNENLEPLKVNDSTFYVREMNEKLVFKPKENCIKLAPKREHEGKQYVFKKLKTGEKTPREYLNDHNFEKALEGYLSIQKEDSLNPAINERNFNKLGYSYLNNNQLTEAINVFKINCALYPTSSNTFDSLGDAYLESKDTINAISSFKKALAINPENRGSLRKLQKLTTE